MLSNTILIILLTTTLVSTGSAYHYKNKFEALSSQPHINTKSTIHLVRELSALATDIRIATYPSECDEQTQAIIGEGCDLGSYMEWAGPALEKETDALLLFLQQEK